MPANPRGKQLMPVMTTVAISVNNKPLAWRQVDGDKAPELLARLIAILKEADE